MSVKKIIMKVMMGISVVMALWLAGVFSLTVTANAETDTYSENYLHWSQGTSKYPSMQAWGCRVVAFSKLLTEAGYNDFGTPDQFYEYALRNGYIYESCAEKTETSEDVGKVIVDYIGAKTNAAVSHISESLTGNREEDNQRIMQLLKEGYYIILTRNGHTTYISKELSLANSYSIISDSWEFRTCNPYLIMQFTNYPYGDFVKIHGYRIEETIVDSNNFPDANFRQYVSDNFDADADGKLVADEIENAKRVVINRQDITTFKGIELLKNLQYFEHHFLPENIYPQEYNLSGLDNLENIIIACASLDNKANAKVNVRNMSNLKKLQLWMCTDCVDITGCTQLENLDLWGLPIEDIQGFESAKSSLRWISLIGNDIEDITIMDMPALKHLNISDSYIKNITVGNVDSLEYMMLAYLSEDCTLNISNLLPSLNELRIWSDYNFGQLNLETYPMLQNIEIDCPNTKYIKYNPDQDYSKFFLKTANLDTPIIKTAEVKIADENIKAGNLLNKTTCSLSCVGYNSNGTLGGKFIYADRQRITWTSSNPSVASVSVDGTIVAHQQGVTTITASFYDTNLLRTREFSKVLTVKSSIWPDINKLVLIKCPVDVNIYDGRGELVGRIENNQTVSSGDSVSVDILDDMKVIGTLDDIEYSFEMIGTDTGMLNVSVFDYTGGNLIKGSNFYNIELESGKVLSTTIPATEITSLDDLKITSEEETYSINEILVDDTLNTLSINLDVTTGGSVDGRTTYSKGEIAALYASAYEGYRFDGWYAANGDCLSKESAYYFEILDTTDLEARFVSQYVVEFDLQNLTIAESSNNNADIAYSFTLETTEDKYQLPETVTIISDDRTLIRDEDYTYDSKSGIVLLRELSSSLRISARALSKNEVIALSFDNPIVDATLGTSKTLLLLYDGYGQYSGDVEWKIIGNESVMTTISDEGVLYVDIAEKANELQVIASVPRNLGIYASCTINLVPRDITNAVIKTETWICKEDYVLPSITVLYYGEKLLAGTDYIISYPTPIVGTGEYEVIVQGIGHYSGEVPITISVKKSIADYDIVGISDIMFANRSITFENLSISADGVELTPNVDYRVNYENNFYPGIAKVIITGYGKYVGEIVKEFSIYCTQTDENGNSHDLERTDIVFATCEEDGCKEFYTCTVCSKIFMDKHAQTEVEDRKALVIQPIGHLFTNYISDNNATYESYGTQTAICDNGCGTKNTIVDVGSQLEKDEDSGNSNDRESLGEVNEQTEDISANGGYGTGDIGKVERGSSSENSGEAESGNNSENDGDSENGSSIDNMGRAEDDECLEHSDNTIPDDKNGDTSVEVECFEYESESGKNIFVVVATFCGISSVGTICYLVEYRKKGK